MDLQRSCTADRQCRGLLLCYEEELGFSIITRLSRQRRDQHLSLGNPGTGFARGITMLMRVLFSVIDKPIGGRYASDEFLSATKLGAS